MKCRVVCANGDYLAVCILSIKLFPLLSTGTPPQVTVWFSTYPRESVSTEQPKATSCSAHITKSPQSASAKHISLPYRPHQEYSYFYAPCSPYKHQYVTPALHIDLIRDLGWTG